MPYKDHHLFILAGLLADKWLSRLGPTAKSLVVIAGLVAGAFGAGVVWTNYAADHGSLPARVSHLELWQDSTRPRLKNADEERDTLKVRQIRQNDVLMQLLRDSNEAKEQRERIICILSGNKGPSCI